MNTLYLIIFLLSFPVLFYFIIRSVISYSKKKNVHALKMLKLIGATAGVMIVSLGAFIMTLSFSDIDESDQVLVSTAAEENQVEEIVVELTDEEKEIAALKLKEEEEAEALAEENRLKKEEAEEKEREEQLAKEKADKMANAETIDYPQLKKNPERYSGEYVKYTGEIVQILEGEDVTNIRLSVTKDAYGYSISDLVFVEYSGYTDFVDGDIITIYGEVYGSYSYESQAGYNISLPGILADEIE